MWSTLRCVAPDSGVSGWAWHWPLQRSASCRDLFCRVNRLDRSHRVAGDDLPRPIEQPEWGWLFAQVQWSVVAAGSWCRCCTCGETNPTAGVVS